MDERERVSQLGEWDDVMVLVIPKPSTGSERMCEAWQGILLKKSGIVSMSDVQIPGFPDHIWT